MYFKIQKGYGKDDFVSIGENELEMAIRAQVTGKVGFFKEGGTVAGNHIISIEPDFDRAEKTYNPSGPDYLSHSVKENHYLAIKNAGEMVKAKMENRQPRLEAPRNPSVRLYTQGPTAIGDLLK